MTEEVTELTAEQKQVLEHGRVADPTSAAALAAAAAKQKAEEHKSQSDPEQQQIDAEQKAKDEEARKAAADAEAAKQKDEVPDDKDDQSWKDQFVQTGNEHADAAIDLMREAGIKPIEANEVFKEAIASGDISKVRWDLLEARLGPAKAKLARAGIENYYATEYKAQTETRDAAYEAVGGEANWNKLRGWAQAKEASDPAFKAKLDNARKAIQIGGDAAASAVASLKALYEADPKNKGFGTNKVGENKGNRSADNVPVGEPLSRAAYFLEKQKADKQYRGQVPDAVLTSLRARRAAGQQQGL